VSVVNFLNDLRGLSGPDRIMDEKIARIGGWVKREDVLVRNGKQFPSASWELDGVVLLKLPFFTGSTDAALLFLNRVCPHVGFGGFSWSGAGRAKAIIGDAHPEEAATPAIAICLAAIEYRLRERQLEKGAASSPEA